MKHLFLAFAWIFLSVGVILTSIATAQISFFARPKPLASNPVTPVQITSPHSNNALALGDVKGVATVMESEDARPEIVSNFLQRYDSPLKPYDYFGQKLVAIADANGIDFRLLPAIAMQESNLCKKIPEGSYNCLGFGIHSRGTLEFESFEANFERAARELKKNYIDQGRVTPESIMRKYTPSSESWDDSVNQWMAEMRYDDRKLGKALDVDANVLEFAKSTATPSTDLNE